ncbi:MAG TPA: VWA domain-containing protein [Bryobacteraceae bacterium]|nr:VWA domain-containing protein [Bryobacteraceae bacterium]
MMLRIIAGVALIPAFLWAADQTQSDDKLLDLTVVALDNHGQPVTDLTAADFQVTDAGKPQNISLFRKNIVSAARQSQAPAVSANQFTNRSGGSPRNAVVVLMDMLNMGYAARGMAAHEIVRNFEGIKSSDSLYLYLLSVNGRFFPIHGISPGEAPPPGPPGVPWTRGIKPMMDAGLRAVLSFRSPNIDVFVRTELTFRALEALGEQLSAIPGRKIIVWVTDGVPVALGEMRSDTGFPIDFTPLIRQLSQALERSNIALYPVRQIMLGRGDNIGADSGGFGATGGAGTGLQSIATLDLFADFTGGRRSAGKDIAGAIQQAMRDLQFSYQIGYYVPASNWNGKFHKLRVNSRRKGVRIQAKAGYYAWKTEAGSRTNQAFAAIASAPFDAEEIGLRATLSADAHDRGIRVLNLRIAAGDIALAQRGDNFTDQLRIAYVGYLPNGLIESSPVLPLDVHYSAAQREQALQNGISFTEKLDSSRGESKFRVMVFDRGSNAVGSITIPASAVR